jgi:hypothetical protein
MSPQWESCLIFSNSARDYDVLRRKIKPPQIADQISSPETFIPSYVLTSFSTTIRTMDQYRLLEDPSVRTHPSRLRKVRIWTRRTFKFVWKSVLIPLFLSTLLNLPLFVIVNLLFFGFQYLRYGPFQMSDIAARISQIGFIIGYLGMVIANGLAARWSNTIYMFISGREPSTCEFVSTALAFGSMVIFWLLEGSVISFTGLGHDVFHFGDSNGES